MSRKNFAKLVAAVAALAGISALLVWGYRESRTEMALEAERERPVKAPSRVSVQGGEVIVTIDRAARLASGITVTEIARISHRSEVRAPGGGLPLQSLFELRGVYAAALARAKRPEAALSASRKEYERLKALNDNGKLASDKAVQAAEALWRADAGETEAARISLHALRGSLRQQWGGIITGWLTGGSPELERLANQQDLLLRITLPAAQQIGAAPRSVRIEAADGTMTTARFVSPSPATDPRIQGESFFYLAPGRSRLLPGMNLTAYLPVGSLRRGIVIPASAVVWWQGKAWVYLQKEEERFIRREVPTDDPVKGGWFAPQEVSAHEKLVTGGAQLLQSEEFRSQVQAGEEEGEK